MNAQNDRYLPGDPSKRLIKSVRSALRGYGIRPHNEQMWRDAWEWARAIRDSYYFPTWPRSTEIAAQFVTLMLADMKSTPGFKLPYRAIEKQTPAITARLASANPKAIPAAYEPSEPKQLASAQEPTR